jgi:hypothetical protein
MAFDLKKELERDYEFLNEALAASKEKWLKLGIESLDVSTLIWQCENRIKKFQQHCKTRIVSVEQRTKTEREVMDDVLEESNTILKEIGKIPHKT